MKEDLQGEKLVIDSSKIYGFHQKDNKSISENKVPSSPYENKLGEQNSTVDSSLTQIQSMRSEIEKEIAQMNQLRDLIGDFFEMSENHLNQIYRNLNDQEKTVKKLLEKVKD
ncbi:MAG: hypothetical protein LBI13_09315 [Streptococcaceae bacterium]|jgi:uncharacterized membrane protein YdfJ with MMPL/SSD domain|nr:hypothetical protein [Streptococcaceae bacterium]